MRHPAPSHIETATEPTGRAPIFSVARKLLSVTAEPQPVIGGDVL